ncbi:hypothetical protein GGI13_006678 [Coemansia sp. RSA 455]|nr:hypothetical protein GGI13_006678 [Coemansia sp. RSA 455]
MYCAGTVDYRCILPGRVSSRRLLQLRTSVDRQLLASHLGAALLVLARASRTPGSRHRQSGGLTADVVTGLGVNWRRGRRSSFLYLLLRPRDRFWDGDCVDAANIYSFRSSALGGDLLLGLLTACGLIDPQPTDTVGVGQRNLIDAAVAVGGGNRRRFLHGGGSKCRQLVGSTIVVNKVGRLIN